jgi:uncharacterized protein (TIGR03437 family)
MKFWSALALATGVLSLPAAAQGESATVAYAGPQGQFAGVDQVNVAIPRALAGSGEVSVYLVADGKLSNMTTINIQ